MLRTMMTVLVAALLLDAAAVGAAQPDPKKEVERAEKLVNEFLGKHKADGAKVEVITDTKELAKAFPEHQFVAIHFREWPIAKAPPKPLALRNLVVVAKDGKLLHLTDAKGLEQFFQETLAPIKKDAGDNLVEAWLRLTQEFVQDGFYKFEFDRTKGSFGKSPEGSFMAGRWLKVVPEMGNKGSFKAELYFDAKGKLTKVVEDNQVLRGIRPKCQATRLLDADPVIRAICEQDILVMGKAAYQYLMEQRASASPELRQAIDRIWQQILDENR
jgi:hypothetical protein